jgi:hypothetical protein
MERPERGHGTAGPRCRPVRDRRPTREIQIVPWPVVAKGAVAMSTEAVRQIKLLRDALQKIRDAYSSAYSPARQIAEEALDAVPEPGEPTQEEIEAANANQGKMIRAFEERGL